MAHLCSDADSVVACEHVRLLGVTISSDLSLHKHVSNICAKCFYWLRQLRRVRRSLDAEAAATLVHVFVMSRVDYCNAVLAGAPNSVTNKLQRVLNAAARVVSGTRKYDRGLTILIHADLHWFDVPDRVTYKLGLLMHRCLQGPAPKYLIDCCTPVSDVVGRQLLRSASRLQLVVPRHRLTTLGRRAFAVMGPTVWNSLPGDLRAQQNSDCFCRHLKTFLFSQY